MEVDRPGDFEVDGFGGLELAGAIRVTEEAIR